MPVDGSEMKELSERLYIDRIDTRPLKTRVFEALRENPYLSNKKLCKVLGISYRLHGKTVRQYRWLLKTSTDFVDVSSASKLHWRVFGVVADNTLFNRDEAVAYGWHVKRNRNRSLAWLRDKGVLGWIDWGNRGKIIVRLKGNRNLGHLKQLFYNAFARNNLVDELSVVDDAFDRLEEIRRHHVFTLNENLPKFNVSTFGKTHGLRVYTDNSHAKAIEIEETVPLGVASRLDSLDEKLNHLVQGSMTSQQLLRANLGLLQASVKADYERKRPKHRVRHTNKPDRGEMLHVRGPLGLWAFPVFNSLLKLRRQPYHEGGKASG